MLENQLYKNASSLEAYLSRSTLKVRLGKLASAITSHYKKATQARRGSTRSSSSSISSLTSLENAFADSKLRRASSSSIPPLPSSLNNRCNNDINNTNMGRNDISNNNNNNNNRSNLGGVMPFVPNIRSQSDSFLPSSGISKASASLSSLSSTNDNNISNQNAITRTGNNTNLAGGSLGGGALGTDVISNEFQQQFLASIRQQQQNLVRQMSAGGSNSSVINAPPANTTPNMSMMGVGGNFAMLNPQPMMQQHSAMTMNLLQQQQQQQQQNMLFQQQRQHHQPRSQGALSLHNIAIMQHQQQMQMYQNPITSMTGVPMNNNAMGMNLMNTNLSAVIPGLNSIQNSQMQAMMSNPMAMAGNNNGIANMMDVMTMPSTGMVGATAISAQERHSSVGNVPTNGEEPNCPLSPRSFDW
jgi:hypothetical protein